MKEQKIIPHQLERNGQVPNNSKLPFLVYQQIFESNDNLMNRFEEAFQQNSWGGTWINGIFNYHHYHSTAHEVLGVLSGTATVAFGGPNKLEIDVQAGDMVVLPAGTGHCLLSASDDFKVIGAYPKGQEDYDICTEKDDIEEKKENIRQVALPTTDPISGESGPLMEHWNA
jgi:uncharacterized protein YjlB